MSSKISSSSGLRQSGNSDHDPKTSACPLNDTFPENANANSHAPMNSARPNTRSIKKQPTSQPTWIVPAHSSDLPAIRDLLISVFQTPISADFDAIHDNPWHDLSDRLLMKIKGEVSAHIHITSHFIRFGRSKIQVGRIHHLVTTPERRSNGLATHLLRAAEDQINEDGASLGMLRTQAVGFFARHGWIPCQSHLVTSASPRDVLAHLDIINIPTSHSRPLKPLTQHSIRLWRQFEQSSLMRIYQKNTSHACGPVIRSPGYWRWLLSCDGYDRIYVAIDGPDRIHLNEDASQIIGYAVMRNNQIIEFHTSCDNGDVERHLLSRICADAIERDDYSIELCAMATERLHKLILDARGTERPCKNTLMMKAFDPLAFFHQIRPELHLRSTAASLRRPRELGLVIGNQNFRIKLTQRGARISERQPGRSFLAIPMNDFQNLLLGQQEVANAVRTKRWTASTRMAIQTASAIFPTCPIWSSPWDDI